MKQRTLDENQEQPKIFMAQELIVFFNQHMEEIYRRYQQVLSEHLTRRPGLLFTKPDFFNRKLHINPSHENIMYENAINFIIRNLGPHKEKKAITSLEDLRNRLINETNFTSNLGIINKNSPSTIANNDIEKIREQTGQILQKPLQKTRLPSDQSTPEEIELGRYILEHAGEDDDTALPNPSQRNPNISPKKKH